jgi:hypothetical protein
MPDKTINLILELLLNADLKNDDFVKILSGIYKIEDFTN